MNAAGIKNRILIVASLIAIMLGLGAAANAKVVATQSTLDFGIQTVGTASASLRVTLTNHGHRRVMIRNVDLSQSQFLYVGPSFPVELEEGESLTASVTFKPDAVRRYSGTLTFVRYNGSTIEVELTGAGTPAVAQQPPATAPVITAQPASKTVIRGQSASFLVANTGTAPFGYQWSKNGVPIAGATSSSYTTPPTTSADNGAQFAVVVSNGAGNGASSAATVTVTVAAVGPSIVTQPASRTVTAGQAASFNVAVTGTAPFTYQWSRNGAAIAGALSSSYSTPAVNSGDNGAQFAVVVSNSVGSITSSRASVTVTAAASAPTITSQPANKTVNPAQTASFTVSASGTGTLSYQWSKNGAPINGATMAAYMTPPATNTDNGAQFSVVVTNSAGSTPSSAASLTVSAGTLVLNASPATLSFGSVALSASGTKTVTLTNAGTANVAITNVSVSGAGFNASGISAGSILLPGQSMTLAATFSPAGAGSASGTVTVASNASNSPGSIAMTGMGAAPVRHSVTLSWDGATSPVTGYNAYSGTASGGPYARITAVPTSLTTYMDTTVKSGNTYFYVVTSVDLNSLESPQSAEISAQIP